MTPDPSLAERIRALRLRCGFSQQFLADFLGINRVSLARIEAKQTHVKAVLAVRLADALGVTLDYLLRGIEK